MKYRILSQTEQQLFGAEVMCTFDNTDVAALGASTTGNIAVVPGTTNGAQPAVGTSGTDTLPAGYAIKFKYLVVDTAFVSGTAAGLAITIGDSGSATRHLASTQLQSGQSPVTGAVGITNEYYIATAIATNVYFTSTTANLSTFTAGQARAFFSLKDLSQLPKS